MEKATGSDTNYYLVDIPNPKRLAPYKAECEDIMEALGMTFAEGSAFKAIWRSCAARTLGVVKPGMDPQGIYDAEKVIYYGNRMLAKRKQLPALLKSQKRDTEFSENDTVWIYDRYRFAIPVKGRICGFAKGNDGVEITLITTNSSQYPVGTCVWVSKRQLEHV